MDPSSWGRWAFLLTASCCPGGKRGLECPLLAVSESGWKLLLVSKGEQYEEAVAEAKGWYPCCIRSWAWILLTWKEANWDSKLRKQSVNNGIKKIHIRG